MEWKIRYWGERQRVAVLVSRYDHCLMDLLWRWRRGELYADIVGVISNHPDLAEEAGGAGVPFHHVPVAKDAKEQAEERMLELLRGKSIWSCSPATCRSSAATSWIVWACL